MSQFAKLTAVQAAIINNARAGSGKDERQQIKREVFSVVKAKFGIPQNVRVKANTKGADQRGYLILHDKQGNAFQLDDAGQFDGTLVSKDQMFPPPAAAPASVFGSGAAPAKWFRLDAEGVAGMLTDDNSDDIASDLLDTTGGDLPVPNLMLSGRTDLAITADGSVYRLR